MNAEMLLKIKKRSEQPAPFPRVIRTRTRKTADWMFYADRDRQLLLDEVDELTKERDDYRRLLIESQDRIQELNKTIWELHEKELEGLDK